MTNQSLTTRFFFLVAIATCCVGCSPAPNGTAGGNATDGANGDAIAVVETEPAPAAFYTIAHYDEQGDPVADLKATVARAQSEKKRILLQVGGEWCGWCHRMSDYMQKNDKIRQSLEDNFVVMKVTYPGEHAEAFLSDYPAIDGYPHLFVLESDGTLLHSQGTAELEEGEGYSQEVFYDFLTSWTL